jgi:hypothetical protein
LDIRVGTNEVSRNEDLVVIGRTERSRKACGWGIWRRRRRRDVAVASGSATVFARLGAGAASGEDIKTGSTLSAVVNVYGCVADASGRSANTSSTSWVAVYNSLAGGSCVVGRGGGRGANASCSAFIASSSSVAARLGAVGGDDRDSDDSSSS